MEYDNAAMPTSRLPLLVTSSEYYRTIATITDVARTFKIPRHIKSIATFMEEYALNPERCVNSVKRLIAVCEQTSQQGVPGVVVLTCPVLPVSVSYEHQEKAGRLLRGLLHGIALRAPGYITVIVADEYQHIPVHLIGENQRIPSLSLDALPYLRQHIALRVMALGSPYFSDIDFDKLALWASHVDLSMLHQSFLQAVSMRPANAAITEYDLVVALYHATSNARRKRFFERQLVAMLDMHV